MNQISGGGAREWLQPQDSDGNLRPNDAELDIRGSHKGFYTGLNVVNPQAGMEYQIEHWRSQPGGTGRRGVESYSGLRCPATEPGEACESRSSAGIQPRSSAMR